jgi:hypothetical protein
MDEAIRIGVRGHGAPEAFVDINKVGSYPQYQYWKQAKLRFTTGPDTTSATVFITKTGGLYDSWVDDVGVIHISGGSAAALESWRLRSFGQAGNFGPAADTADPDDDGVQNLAEYALGTSPTVKGGPAIEGSFDDQRLKIRFSRLSPSAMSYTVLAGEDLASWQPLASLAPGTTNWTLALGATVVESDEPAHPGVRFTTITDGVTADVDPARFMRLVLDSQ